MDEEDGRLGPTPGHIIGNAAIAAPVDVTALRARQSGRTDALTDAFTKPLHNSSANLPNPGCSMPPAFGAVGNLLNPKNRTQDHLHTR